MGKWIMTVFSTAAAVGVIGSLCQKGPLKEILSMAGAVVVAIAFFAPVREAVRQIGALELRVESSSITQSVEQANEKSEALLKSIVDTHVASYIMEEAEKEGISCTVKVTSFMDENGEPAFRDTEICYTSPPTANETERVEAIAAQCGIAPDSIRHVEQKGGLS